MKGSTRKVSSSGHSLHASSPKHCHNSPPSRHLSMENKRLRRKRRRSISRTNGFSVLACALILTLISHTGSYTSLAQSTLPSLSYNDLKPCNLSSVEMSSLDPSVFIVPCIAWDVAPYTNSNSNSSVSDSSNTTNSEVMSSPLITVIQVTPHQCSNHRDGAPTAVDLLNSQNDGRGPAIGYRKDHYVQFLRVPTITKPSRTTKQYSSP